MAPKAVYSLNQVLTIILTLFLVPAVATADESLSFSKEFLPSTIGPGSTSLLSFEIINYSQSPAADLAFTDILPAGVVIATPSSAQTDCTDAILDAPDGGTTISMSGGRLGSGACFVRVNVTSASVGTHQNVSSSLTSSLPDAAPATADLIVDAGRPGFIKSFVPSSIPPGGISTLILSIDNSSNEGSQVSDLNFTDPLPAGMVIAAPANAATTCNHVAIPANLVAEPGGSSISLTWGTVAALSTCEVTVDVTAADSGRYVNTTGQLVGGSNPSLSSGFATAALDAPVGFLGKSFTDDPVSPGGSVTLEFNINNPDRLVAATNISFSDDLGAVLPGLAPTGALPGSPCGAGSSLSFAAGVLTLTGGSLPPAGSCTFGVSLTVPGETEDNSYTNITTPITAVIGGSAVVGNQATDNLVVESGPILTKTFLDDPVGAGGSVTLRFTITNPSSTHSLGSISFEDVFDVVMPTASLVPADGFCGPSSTATFIPLVIPPPPSSSTPASLVVSGASLGVAGSCTFDIELDVATGAATGTYANTTSVIEALLASEIPVTGAPASDTLEVVAAPALLKEFTDDPSQPGGTVTLEFTLTHDPNAPGDATDITFTDNLTATLDGLAAVGLPTSDVCGAGSQLIGTTNLSLTGGTLTPGASCTFSATLQIPETAPAGRHENTTSSVVATVLGKTATENAARDSLRIAGLTLAKEFTDDPVLPGGTVNLRFTIDNTSPISDATNIFFRDDLDTVFDGLVAIGLPLNDICGAGSSLLGSNGDTLLTLAAGNLLVGESCIFDITLQVPAGAEPNTYVNSTSDFSAVIDNTVVVFDNASDNLIVSDNRPLLSKEFTDDPAQPGGTATLEFTLTNPDTSQSMTGLTFTDDLDAALTGLAAIGLPASNVCGAGSQLTGTGNIELTGGVLAASSSCTFSVTLQVPADAELGAVVTNTTSEVVGMLGNLQVTGDAASADLQINYLTFTKAFDGPTVAGGSSTLMFTIANLNTGNAVTEISFSDDLEAVVSGLAAAGLPANDVCGPGSVLNGTSLLTLSGGNLLPGGSCTFSVNLEVPESATVGTYTNTTSDLLLAGLAVALPATADLEVIAPAIEIQKTPDLQTILTGGTASFDISVSNTGTGDLTNVVVTDPAAPDCNRTIGALATGATVSYNCTLAGVTADFTNIASVATDAPAGPQLSVSDDAAVDVVEPAIDIQKTPDLQTILTGGAASFDISVSNTGTGDLTNVVVTDPAAPDCDRTIGALATGATVSYNCTLAGVTADFTNTASVAADAPAGPPLSVSDDAAVDVVEPAIDIQKTPDLQTILTGGTASFDISVSNTGTGDLTNVVVTDPAAPDCDRTIGALATGATVSYNCTLAGVTADFTNTASIAADTPAGPPLSVSDDAVVDVVDPGISIQKTPDLQTILTGGTASFDISVSNTGTADLTNVVVTDPAALGCDRTIGALATGETVSYNCTLIGVTADFTNTVSVAADAPAGPPLSVSDDAVVDVVDPGIDIQKTPDLQTILTGGTASFDISVSNTGTADLTNVVVTDPAAPGCDRTIGALATGATVSYNCTLANVTADFTNTASVAADAPAGPQLSISDDAVVDVADPGISIQKTPDSQTVSYAGTATFTIAVENTGDANLENVTVTDPLAPDCDRSIGTLAAAASTSYTCTLSGVTEGFTNTAKVTGDSTAGPVESSDIAVVEIEPPVTCFTGPTATETGDATLCFNGGGPSCGFSEVQFIPVEGGPLSPPAGTAPPNTDFPHGLVSFVLNNCEPGFTAEFTLEVPDTLPVDTKYWKHGPTPENSEPHWYVLPSTVADNRVSFSIVDGGLGDDGLTADGTTEDAGGPGAPILPPVGTPRSIPTLTIGPLILMASLLALLGFAFLRRRPQV